MRAAIPLLLVALAACGGGDDDTTDSGTDTDAAATTTTVQIEPIVPEDDCETVPDPADYPEGEIPPAARPCEVPEVLVVSTVREGAGRNAQDGDTLIVDYIGMRSEDGAIFDDSYTRGVPLDVTIGRGGVIVGWDEGLIGTQAGSLVKLDIPPEMAYGANPPGGDGGVIQPDDALTFVVEVRSVIPLVSAEDAPLDLEIEPSIDATEVSVTVLEEGDGPAIEPGQTAVVHLLLVRGDNQVVLFNTWEESDPLQIIVADGQTFPGIVEGLEGVTVGSRVVIAMPPEDAFGESGNPQLGLPAGTDLIAVIDVVGVY